MTKISALQRERANYQPKIPESIRGIVKLVEGEKTRSAANQDEIARLFPATYGLPIITFEKGTKKIDFPPVNVGVVLSGGQAPGGHNVISGLFDGIKAVHSRSRLYGFLGGPEGLMDHRYMELTAEIVDAYRNTGGFDIIGSGRTKLDETEQFDKSLEILKDLDITALVIIGGDDSNTNAAILAEYYAANKTGVQVIGCPKTIDGDLKNGMIEASFGFDTATKVYSGLIGNIQRDANSAKKYWHFIKLMGRSASHIALECALKTQPNITLISEEVADRNQTLDDIVEHMAAVIAARAEDGNNFGVALIPEGLIEYIPEMSILIRELNELLAEGSELEKEFKMLKKSRRNEWVASQLTKKSAKVFNSLPSGIRTQLTLDRDPHGNVQVSMIETEKLLGEMVKSKLQQMTRSGKYVGKFGIQYHFFGYEGRCAAPSNFDADYTYALGYTASGLIAHKKTGYMTSVRNLTAPSSEWITGGVPITMMMNVERRKAQQKPVIQKALVNLKGAPFKYFVSKRGEWAHGTHFVYPGPIQYFGPSSVCDIPTETLLLEKN
jgi:diphosphate-dependent phosphofructokinase